MSDPSSLRIGVIGIPGKWSTESLADEITAHTGFRLVIDMGEVSADLEQGRLDYQGIDLCQLDGLVVKKIDQRYSPSTLDRLELLRIAESSGVRIFSPTIEIIRLIDRLACTVTLRNGGIPMPETVITEKITTALDTIEQMGAVVLKPLYSTKARGMIQLQREMEPVALRQMLEQFHREHRVLYIQQQITLPGEDLGLIFLGGEYLGSYSRVVASGSWNSTTRDGGRYHQATPSPEVIELARKAQSLFRLDFTTVDLVESSQGPLVFEVSAFGGFRGALEGAGINAAAHYARHIIKQLS